jgi:hypothetical protein
VEILQGYCRDNGWAWAAHCEPQDCSALAAAHGKVVYCAEFPAEFPG